MRRWIVALSILAAIGTPGPALSLQPGEPPEAEKIFKQALEHYPGLGSFYLKLLDRSPEGVEQLVEAWYQAPFLRVVQHPKVLILGERRLTVSAGDIFIVDFGANRGYFQRGSHWEGGELFVIEEFRVQAALTLAGLDFFRPWRFLRLEEEILEGRPTWRLTAEPSVRIGKEDHPAVAFWICQDTGEVVQYEKLVSRQAFGTFVQERWTSRILEFQPHTEVPREMFAVPEGVPVHRVQRPGPTGTADQRARWGPYTEERLEQARATGKPIVLYFTATWCIPCLEFTAWDDPRVVQETERFVCLEVDLTNWGDARVRALKTQYKVVYLPLVLILSPQAEEIRRLEGLVPVQELLDFLRSVQ